MKAIITADWHLRKDLPRCRLDEDWMETQRKVLNFIVNKAQEKWCEIYIVGDVFHTSRQSEELVNIIIDELQASDHDTYIMPGNHDLAYNQYDNIDKSSYGILIRSFAELIKEKDFVHCYKVIGEKFLFVHQLTFPSKKEQIVIDGKPVGKTAQDLLDEYPEAKWIFTGDYHKHFHYCNDMRHVINPGCITRQASDFIDYKPVVYYIDTEKEIIEVVYLPDTGDMVTDQYIKEESARNERIESFISTIKSSGEVSLNFIDNLRGKLGGLNEGSREVMMEVLEEVVLEEALK